MTLNMIRAKSCAILRRKDGAILVDPGFDNIKGQHFGRIIGGGIEFGETSEQAIIRELQEELGITVTPTRLLGWIENIFTYEGNAGHQLFAIWDVTYDNPDFYKRDSHKILDTGNTAEWLSRDRMRSEDIKLYPTGLAELVWPGKEKEH